MGGVEYCRMEWLGGGGGRGYGGGGETDVGWTEVGAMGWEWEFCEMESVGGWVELGWVGLRVCVFVQCFPRLWGDSACGR